MSDYITTTVGGATIVQLNRPAPEPAQALIVTRRQALRALHEAGLLDDVESAINGLPEPQKTLARIDWDNATEFRRDFPLLLQLAGALGLTSAQIDSLFAAAASIA